ncbi:MAG TPA: IS701 family transposase [Streptosporangiaceae bacterium]|nr:IS701 family transposase [Streptosporangiaceae bacterium]
MTDKIDETVAVGSLGDIAAGVRAVEEVIWARLGGVFAQARSRRVAKDYVEALGTRAKANCWALAETAGHDGWGRMQALLNRYSWEFTAVRDQLAPLAGRWLTCPDGDPVGPGIALDETAALKKGDHTFAVAPQHAGCTGKVENCVTTVFAAYVVPAGSCWVDFDVYMPQRWADDPARRARAGVPEDLAFTTKPDLAAAQLRRLAGTGLRFSWVAGDEVYGRSSTLRATCTELGVTSVFIVPTSFTITTPAGERMTAAAASDLATSQDSFERRDCGMGSKGARLSDWALVATADPHEVLLIRRLISRPEQMTYYICHVPDPTQARLPYLATIAGRRWPVEETFKIEKDVFGYDQSQARTYTAVNRHTVLAALAGLRQVAARIPWTQARPPTGTTPAQPTRPTPQPFPPPATRPRPTTPGRPGHPVR